MVTSLDLELAWGTFHRGWHRRYASHLLQGRQTVGRILDLFERHEVPATWAVVGHLFLEACAREHGVEDPCTDVRRDPLWYGPDLVERITRCRVPQEIGSHSFSHVSFGDPACHPALARAELAACTRLAQAQGFGLRAFVFPQDRAGHLELLREAGFSVFRGRTASVFRHVRPRWLGRLRHVIDDALGLPAATVEPREVLPGLWELPGSMMYGFMFGPRRFIPVGSRVRRAKQGIEQAIRRRRIFHLWFHPCTLGYRERELLAGLEEIYAYAGRRRRAGALELVTMSDAVRRWQGRGAA
jgi:peptidoglycan/xylan/chitin deacetylase (PgdA/CDA1 family)